MKWAQSRLPAWASLLGSSCTGGAAGRDEPASRIASGFSFPLAPATLRMVEPSFISASYFRLAANADGLDREPDRIKAKNA